MATSGQVRPLGSLLNEAISLEVPDFQRSYSWEDANIDAFHQDVCRAYSAERRHFLGALILLDKGEEFENGIRRQDIIDGQQRLTTIFMYLAILRDRLAKLDHASRYVHPAPGSGGVPIDLYQNANAHLFSDLATGRPRFQSNYLLAEVFFKFILADPESNPNRPVFPRRDKQSTLRLRKAYWRLEDLIAEFITRQMDLESKHENEVLDGLLQVFNRKLELLTISTSTLEESFDIFMTMNNRGLSLGPGDLVKSLFMKHISAGKSGADLIAANNSVTDPWTIANDNIEDGDMNQYLRHYLLSEQRENVQGKEIFGKFEGLISRTSVDGQPTNPIDQCKKQLTRIVEKSEIYKQLLKHSLINDKELSKYCGSMYLLLDSYRIFMLNLLDESIDIERGDRRELGRLCETLSLRWILSGSNAQVLENFFQEIANDLCDSSRELSIRIRDIREKFRLQMPQDNRVKSRFNEEIDSTNLVRVVLYRINEVLTDNTSSLNQDPTKLNVEHIAPQTYNQAWMNNFYPGTTNFEEKAPEYSALVEQWGNKSILEYKINAALKQAEWLEKRDGFNASSGELIKGYTHSAAAINRDFAAIPSWTQAQIAKRNRWIADCFLKIWGFEPSENIEHFSHFKEP
jgi:Protein of unknown function DUF262/Protein of unknown function (DUF1524)